MKLGRRISRSRNDGSVVFSNLIVFYIALACMVFLVWASFAKLDEVIRGLGAVTPEMSNQIVQNLEGGIVRSVHVTEGDLVMPDQLLVQMDDTKFRSAFHESQNQFWALSIRLKRLELEESFSSDFEINFELPEEAVSHIIAEQQLFRSRRRALLESVDNTKEGIGLREAEVRLLKSMVELSAVPQIELLRAEQAVIEAQERLISLETDFETKRSEEYSQVLKELLMTEEQMRARADQLKRTQVLSPVSGIVNKVLATTVGGVVQPGEPLLEIIVMDGGLRVKGKIDPRDIGFVYIGMPATIKLTAFDFSIYGTLSGEVSHVGADTVTDEQGRDPIPYFEVNIDLDETVLNGPLGIVEIRPGMQAEIELNAGEKTVMQYLLKPLFKATDALSER